MSNGHHTTERLAPHSVEAEEALLGSILISPDALYDVLPVVTAVDFFIARHGWIFEAVLEIHKDAVGPGSRVVIIDDLLATGGTALAAARLVEKLGGQVVKVAFLVELLFLAGRKKLSSYDLFSLIQY